MKKVYLFAVLFALLAGGATYIFAQQLQQKTSFKDANTQTVLVATQEVPANTRMTASAIEQYFEERDVVEEYVVSNAIGSKAEVSNQVTKTEIYAGQQAQRAMFVGSDSEDASLSVELDAGEVAYSITAEAVLGVDGYIVEGDTVDIISCPTSEDSVGSARYEFEDLEVLRVATNAEQTEADAEGTGVKTYASVTLKVTEEQALKLYDMEQDGAFKLVLNSRGNK
ncbi:MAG: Flp pilus assembly protein CpaB [Eubacterium sp.]